ncbi:hypothetical protein PDE_01232 [Penicillium oxalicum 114-2]|uniref:opdI n=1 Tax=Penicillium oxalicum (strain 114-2 / CGMCC 5302) TaxID=933388 RepID=OPDI_PENO1
MRGYRSSQRTFFRGFDPRHAYRFRGDGRHGGMGGALKIVFLGMMTYFIAKKAFRSSQHPPTDFNAPVQSVPQRAQRPSDTRLQGPVLLASNHPSGDSASPE